MHPDIRIVRVHRDSVVPEEHYTQVTHLNVMCAFETHPVTVEGSIHAYPLKRYVLKQTVSVVAPLKIDVITILEP